MLTECLHVVIKVLAVDQLPRSAECLNHVCTNYWSGSGSDYRAATALPAVNLALPAGQINTVPEGGTTSAT